MSPARTRTSRTARRIPVAISALLLAAALTPLPAGAQESPPDYSGTWPASIIATLPDDSTCAYDAQVKVQQSGSVLTGFVELTITAGARECPDQANGDLLADVTTEGCLESGVFDGGQMFGAASFDGCPTGTLDSLSGTFSVYGGPFLDTTGSWRVTLQGPGIPAVSTHGLAALLLLLALSGAVILRHR